MMIKLRTLCILYKHFFFFFLSHSFENFFPIKERKRKEKLRAVSRSVSFVQILRFCIDCTSSPTYTQVTTLLWRAHQSISSRAFKITVRRRRRCDSSCTEQNVAAENRAREVVRIRKRVFLNDTTYPCGPGIHGRRAAG